MNPVDEFLISAVWRLLLVIWSGFYARDEER
jgi:hypothetical protein